MRTYAGPQGAPDPRFTSSALKSKSKAAALLCEWVVNLLSYHDIFLEVEPKRWLLVEAQEKLKDATRKLTLARERLAVLDGRKQSLQDQLVAATEEKNGLTRTAVRTEARLAVAERLVGGLRDEYDR